MQTAFALGGGGLLGAQEIGMLRALAEAGVRPDLVVGTSVGAINRAFVAADPAGAAARLSDLWEGDALGQAFSENLWGRAVVIFVAHAGLDQLVSVGDVGRSLPLDHTVHAAWWRVPAGEVPRAADHGAQVRWLYDWWQRINTWIARHRPGDAEDEQAPAQRGG